MLTELNGDAEVSPSKFARFKETVKTLLHLTVEAVEAVNDETAIELRSPAARQEHGQEEQEC